LGSLVLVLTVLLLGIAWTPVPPLDTHLNFRALWPILELDSLPYRKLATQWDTACWLTLFAILTERLFGPPPQRPAPAYRLSRFDWAIASTLAIAIAAIGAVRVLLIRSIIAKTIADAVTIAAAFGIIMSMLIMGVKLLIDGLREE
jgi:hypothetical protein